MWKKYLYIIALLFVTIGINNCKKVEVDNQTSNAHLKARATHFFADNEDEKEFELILELDQVVLVREISMKIGTHQWDIKKPEYNAAGSWLSENNGVSESIIFSLTTDSLSAMIAPEMEDYPDKYGYDMDAYRAADDKYKRAVQKAEARILEEVFTSLKKGEPVSFEIRGKMKNMKVSVSKSDIDNAIEVWDIYKQM
ncbi:MAG: hypothetical protein LHW45_06580 [Candidatus Cloacimonetes bacterium]|nr:hypothetical protein [Candidatus Cloacimonadota bacterium]MDY0367276.1 hypothetical protein [Candidatus Syntrophosphaera sp.]